VPWQFRRRQPQLRWPPTSRSGSPCREVGSGARRSRSASADPIVATSLLRTGVATGGSPAPPTGLRLS